MRSTDALASAQELTSAVHIGITTSFNEGEQRLNHAYVLAVERAGGLPLIVPMLEGDGAVQSFVQLLHGLVITGGPAIQDGLIGDLPSDINLTDEVRVRSDKAVLGAFLASKKPVLGICYGMQLLNAAAGGTIFADVSEQREGSGNHSEKRGADVHPIYLERASHLYRILNTPEVDVNTRHLQAVHEVGSPYRVAAVASDGVVEAIENEDGTVLGVQFHPELMGDRMLPLFRHLVENARRTITEPQSGT